MWTRKQTVLLGEKRRAVENHPAIRQDCLRTCGPGLFIGCNMSRTHGHTRGAKKTSIYETWIAMIQRCRNPNHHAWHNYGGRGIVVCKRWKTFENFLADMGERPKGKWIDRINNDGNYEPGNCRWATPAEQLGNTRVCHMLTFHGKTQNVTEWAKELGIPRNCIYIRMGKLGWTVADALRHPSRALLLTDMQLQEIRTSKESGASIGRRFGVDRSTINKIRAGVTRATPIRRKTP